MKKTLSLILAAVTLCGLMTGCTTGDGTVTDPAADATSGAPTEAPTAAPTEAPTEAQTDSPAYAQGYTPIPTTGSIRVLAIGNSFSTDCMQYLWQMLKGAGYDKVILGNLYYGGCSLQQHLGFARADSASYTFYKNTNGSWDSTKNYKLSAALKNEKWDIITFQQTSKTCGLANSYGKTLTELVDIVASKADPDSKFLWNMTWAYQSDSTHSSFPNYDRDQMKMYNMIIECVNSQILTEKRFVGVIPAGTAIQNARTSFMGDHLTRDGYHMDYNIGRYIVALCWYSYLTGLSPETVTFNPATQMITPDMVAAAREAVANSMRAPLAVTESQIKTGEMPGVAVIDPSVVLNPEDFFEADAAVAAANGADLSKYKLLEWDYLENTYWACTSKTGTTTPGASGSTYHQNVCSTRKYSVDTEFPVGSIVIVDAGWQYRLEIYKQENQVYDGTRPSLTSVQFFQLTDTFLHGCKYIAWNVASSPKSDISAIYAQAAAHMRIYVPVTQ